MALTKNAQQQTPSFESEDSAPTAEADASAPAPAPQAQASLPAVAPANPVSTTVRAKFTQALEEFRNQIPPESVEFNTFTRVTVGLDGFEDDAKKDLGKELRLQLMSFNDRWTLSPGSQDADATELVRYSIDGKTVQGTGEACAEYIKVLKDVHGYKDAEMKQYLTVYGMMTHANGKEIPAEDRQIIALQVPPQSRAMFTRLQVESGIKIAQGVLQPTDVLVCRQEKAQGKTTKYAVIKFSHK